MSRAQRILAAQVLVFALLVACSSDKGAGADGRLHVVAAFAPLAEVAEAVGGERVQVRDLTPAGAEPHDLELSTDDIDAVEGADVVLELGGGFQPALERASRRARRRLDLLATGESDDPHIWLDPVRFARVAAEVEGAFVKADPPGAKQYRQRSAAFQAKLAQLDGEYLGGLSRCQRRLIVTSHAAFGRLAGRYGLEQRAITGISPEAEPDSRRLAELADLVRREGVTHIFTERLVSPRVAQSLAREAGVKVAVLDPLESRTDNGYVAAMRDNLKTLRRVLGCP